MELFINQVLAGIATGAIYACMALAVVMIYQAIDHLNFAQGEMAMFSTFIAWQLMQWGVPYWGAFVLTLAFSFAGGIAILLGALLRVGAVSVIIVMLGAIFIVHLPNGYDIAHGGLEYALTELLLSLGLLLAGPGKYSLAGILPAPLRKL